MWQMGPRQAGARHRGCAAAGTSECTEMMHLLVPQLPDLVTQLGLLYYTIESRVKMFHKLTKLHGKLYLLTAQVGSIGFLPAVNFLKTRSASIAVAHWMLTWGSSSWT